MQRQYSPVGACIYCGKSDEPLSKEHIIPYALGGRLILPRASCAKHRNLTSELELRVAREMYGNYRIVQGIQTRRRKDVEARRRSRIELDGVAGNGDAVKVAVLRCELPPVHISVHLPRPQILSGDPITRGGVGALLKARVAESSQAYQRLLHKHRLRSLSIEASIQVETFLRVLAKIGHSFAVASYGLGNFKPVLLPLIEGRCDRLLQYIGCESPNQPQATEPLTTYELVHNGNQYLVVEVSLQSFPQLPCYQIVAAVLNESVTS